MSIVTLPRRCGTAAAAREVVATTTATGGPGPRAEIRARAASFVTATFLVTLIDELRAQGTEEYWFRGLGYEHRQAARAILRAHGIEDRAEFSHVDRDPPRTR